MKLGRIAVLAALSAVPLCPCAPAQPRRPFRFDELARVQRLGGFSLSPDGQWIAYAVSTADVERNRTRSALWLVSAAGGPARRLTSGEKRDSGPCFSPDGRKLAFLSNRDGGSQIWLLDLSGGDPQKATAFPLDIGNFKWSPEGTGFVFTSDVFPECADTGCHVGAAGASYGGYMIDWITGPTDRFAALVSHDGVFDTASMALETEELWFPNWEFDGWPWKSPLYAKWNPMLFARTSRHRLS